jgi:gliding motility-associated-like protein
VPSLSNDLICSDASAVTFNPGTYTSYIWHDGSKDPTFKTKIEGDVAVEVTDSKGCKGKADATLTVIDLPEPNIEGTTMCPDMTQTIIPALIDNSQEPYTYKWHDASTDPSYKASSAETISVEVTDKNGCKASDNAEIKINSVLTPVIVGSPKITRCIDDPTVKLISNYNTIDGYLFEWTDGTTGDLLNENESINSVSTAGTFDLFVHNGKGCEGSTTIDIVVNPLPIMTAEPKNICAGLATEIGVDAQSGSYSYAWNTVPITTTRELTVNKGDTYTQTVTNTSTGCVNDTVFIVTEFPNPTPDIIEQTECLGVELVLRDINDKGETATSIWSGGTGSGPSDSSAYLPLSTATYRLDVIDVNGCVGFDEAVVTFLDIPEVTTQDSIVMCEGESRLLEAQVLDPSNTLSWNTGQGDVASFTVSQNQLHIVTASNGYCETKDSTYVIVLPIPISEIDHTIDDQTYCFEDENFRGVKITAGSNPAYTYLWLSGEVDPTITAMTPGAYSVTITAGQCPIDDEITLRPYCPSFLYVANAFTPDGDGLNDFFSPKAFNLEGDYNFYIYNRWGELIFESSDLNNQWDGTYMNNPCQMDVYVWKVYYSVEHPDGNPRKEQKTGRVSLIR